jgi:hypothetical protein
VDYIIVVSIGLKNLEKNIERIFMRCNQLVVCETVSHDNREKRRDEMKKRVESTAKQKTTVDARKKRRGSSMEIVQKEKL